MILSLLIRYLEFLLINQKRNLNTTATPIAHMYRGI